MIKHKISQAFFLLGMAMLTASLSVMSCGDGGGSSGSAAAAPVPQAGGGSTLHVSNPDPAVAVPAATTSVIRTVQWTAATNEIPIQMSVEGTYTRTGTGNATITLLVYDDTGVYQMTFAGPMNLTGTAANVPFSIIFGPGVMNTNLIPWSHPAPGYRLAVRVTTPGTGSWVINTTTVKILTVTPTVVAPSPAMVEL